MANEKKKAPVKKITPGMKKKAAGKKGEKNQAVAFVNWTVVKGKQEFKGGKGFPIFQNDAYPNWQEDKLVELAEAQGGEVELMMRVKIAVNKPRPEIDMGMFL